MRMSLVPRACATLAALLILMAPAAMAAGRGLVPSVEAKNQALVAGAGHGLPGIDKDIDSALRMVSDESFGFDMKQLYESEATTTGIAESLTQLSAQAEADGTFLFYFTGHGNRGIIYPYDRTMKVAEVRDALEEGRKSLGPLARLVLIFDTCHAGSLLDPFRDLLKMTLSDRSETEAFVSDVVSQMTAPSRHGRAENYWKSLFVFASCRADESSLASGSGSVFTNAMLKAFDEAMTDNVSLATFVSKTQSYTKGHHPVARFEPAEVSAEPMKP